jgi:hypothetical protein
MAATFKTYTILFKNAWWDDSLLFFLAVVNLGHHNRFSDELGQMKDRKTLGCQTLQKAFDLI